jgi:hypothetical protein
MVTVNSELLPYARRWRAASRVRQLMVERGFHLFSAYSGLLAIAAGRPEEEGDLLTFWAERATESVTGLSLNVRDPQPRFSKKAYRSSYIDQHLQRVSVERGDGSRYFRHPFQDSETNDLRPIFEMAEEGKLLELPSELPSAPTLPGGGIDMPSTLRLATEPLGFQRLRLSSEARQNWGDLNAAIYAKTVGSLRFAIGYPKQTWGRPKAPSGVLNIGCIVFHVADPGDFYWMGGMDQLFPEAWIYRRYSSLPSATWGARAMATLLSTFAETLAGS